MSAGLRLLLLASLALLAGCNGPSYTIAELGHGEFEAIVGKETRYYRIDDQQIKAIDAYTDEVDKEADHRFQVTFWPTGDENYVLIGVEVHPRGKLEITDLAAVVYAVDPQAAANFEVKGTLPPEAKPIASSPDPITGEGGMAIKILLPRKDIPEGKTWLAVPTLTKFKDGWIHLRFYKTAVPARISEMQKKLEGVATKEEREDLRRELEAQREDERSPETSPSERSTEREQERQAVDRTQKQEEPKDD